MSQSPSPDTEAVEQPVAGGAPTSLGEATSRTPETTRPIRIAVSYAPKDDDWLTRLEDHLSALRREGLIDVWHRGKIPVGAFMQEEIQHALDAADIILLLVSADYIASDDTNQEMERALVRHDRGEATVLPVLVRLTEWSSLPIGRLQALPSNGRPLARWSDADEGLRDVVTNLRTIAVAKLQARRVRTPPARAAKATPGKPRRIGRLRGAGNDAIATKDHLGFQRYVDAFADLIEAPATTMPLTIGIFGSWGMGKSFLLKHIVEELGERRKKRELSKSAAAFPHVHVVMFNAWEYSATAIIWTGLVRRIMERMEEEVRWGFPGHFLIKLGYKVKKLVRKRLALVATLSVLVIALLAYALWYFSQPGHVVGDTWKHAAAAAAALGLTGAIKVVSDTLSKPLGQRITTFFRGSDYGLDVDHMVETRDDLEFLAKRLDAKKDRLLVVIDDLDRCEPQKAVEVLQAINLLLNYDNVIVCLGVDARIITRAIEDRYKNLLGPAGASGYEYLDKIVQIPFRIPTPGATEVASFLDKLLGEFGVEEAAPASSGTPAAPPPAEAPPAAPRPGEAKPTPDAAGAPPPGPAPRAFSADELDAFKQMARYLRPNPRHLKRLVNVYRLVRTLAEYQGERLVLEDPATAIRWLSICSQWPYTASGMLAYLDEMLDRHEEGTLKELPTLDPLPYLLDRVAPQLSAETQGKIDHDPDLLRMLLQRSGGGLDWDGLRTIRRYTVNFNPAVESELRFDTLKLDAEDGGVPHPAGGAR